MGKTVSVRLNQDVAICFKKGGPIDRVVKVNTTGHVLHMIGSKYAYVQFDTEPEKWAVPIEFLVPLPKPIDCAERWPLSSAEQEVMRQLFLDGPTWDGDVVSKEARKSLVGRGLVEHDFGYAWLNRNGTEISIHSLQLDKEKDKRDRQRRG